MTIASGVHLKRLTVAADWLAVAVAASLPWSTSLTGILVPIWLAVLIPTMEWRNLRAQLTTAVGGLPILLFLLGAVGVAWADVSWRERLGGFDGFVRLLVLPILMAQFSRSERGRCVLVAFLVSCTALLIASFLVAVWPQLQLRERAIDGVPVKTYIVQSLEFVMCAAAVFEIGRIKASLRQWKSAAGFVVLGLAFLADIFFVSTGRTTLAVIPALVVVYGIWRAGWKGLIGASVMAAVLAPIVWFASPFVRERVTAVYTETMGYERHHEESSSGVRIEFWKKSLRFIATAPVLGHGTGSIVEQFARAEVGNGVSALPSSNPHNQTFAVGIQLGLVGIAVLWAMWISQLWLFRGSGSVMWVGLVVVTSNIVGSLFNSFIFDFTEGWIYVFGVGVLAGMVQRPPDAATAQASAAKR